LHLSLLIGTLGTDLRSTHRLCTSNEQIKHSLGDDMARKKLDDKDKQKFQNVGLIKADHALLRELAKGQQRSMAGQLSVLIRKAVAEAQANV